MEKSSAGFALTVQMQIECQSRCIESRPKVRGSSWQTDGKRRSAASGLAHCLVLLLRLLERFEHGVRAGIEHNWRALAGSQNAGFIFERRSSK